MSTSTDSPVPHFTTALTGPLLLLERQILDRQSAIESWFRSQWRRSPAPFYASVDLRNSGYKVAPVDTNLFPAGFNNLNPAFDALSIQALQQAVEHLGAPVDRIVIVPESHTRNLFYLENLAVLQRLLERAGFAVRLGSLLPELKEETVIPLPSGASARLAPLVRNGRRVMVGDFDPDFVLLNNDPNNGTPPFLYDI